jgi:uncharacterized membrane protein
MGRFRDAAAIAGGMTAALALAALSVTPGLTVRNKCNQDIVIAVHYRAASGWATTPFVSVAAGRSVDRVASSDNAIFYYYAESLSGGHKWAGDQNFRVDGKPYPMKKKELELDSQRNRFLLLLSCG